jgi:sigma-54 dependent transcriptional regulator, acetoin dehydrogenase operon transcriptional activator AcoR
MTTQGLPAQPFFQTPEQRAALARQRYFEEHASPSGLVSDAVVHSWNRSRSLGHVPTKLPALDPVSKSSQSAALARNQALLSAAQLELHALESSLAGTRCRVILTDANGVIVHVMSGEKDPHQDILNLASRVGVNLAEGHLGTTAPGIVVQTCMASAVLGGEHYYDMFQAMRCAAAPIRDIQGRMVGVLDVSTEARDFGFDALSVVGIFATSIENRLLRAQSEHLLVLHFQTARALLDTPLEGLVGVSTDGRVEWVNGSGRSLLGRHDLQTTGGVEEILGTDLNQLLALCGTTDARLMHLPCGLGIWVRAEMRAARGIDFCHAVTIPSSETVGARPTIASASEEATDSSSALPAGSKLTETLGPLEPPSLAQALQRLIEQTLAANEGNVARTARLLGISRGMVYRHLKRSTQPNP